MDEFIVDLDELEIFRRKMEDDGKQYDAEIDRMLQLIEKLRQNWIGVDADAFCENYFNYLKKMKSIPVSLKNMSDAVVKVNKMYDENENESANEFEKEATNYVEYESSN